MDSKEALIQSLVTEGYLKTPRIIEAFRAIDRADFVLPEYRDEAYGNYPLPIGNGQTISQPLTIAFMLELLDPQPGENILDIGAGSGWQTALLVRIAGSDPAMAADMSGGVTAVERIKSLCDFAKNNLDKYGFVESGRVKLCCFDATAEIPEGNYDKIIAAAAAPRDIPGVWREKLRVGGKIVAPVGGSIWLFIKKSDGGWEEKEFPGFAFVPLIQESRMKKSGPRKYFNFFLVSCFLLLASAMILSVNEIYTSVKRAPVFIEIPSGAGSRQIADILKKEDVIRSKWIFVFYASVRGVASELKPGRYTWGRVSLHTVGNDLVRGVARERVITIPEGWSTKDIAAYLEQEGFVAHDAFLESVSSHSASSRVWGEKFPFLKDIPPEAGLEGYLFPDTYRIFINVTLEDIIKKMLDNFDKKLTVELREEITRQDKTIFEVVTMASLIEKEVVLDEDRVIVSGILWKRLGRGIPLQIDATITYITGKRTTKISHEETQIGSPYNTYKYTGLPVGPIANPGLSAIRAAIYQKQSPYLYYLSTPDGTTIFSRTLEEHNEAKAKYLMQ